MHLGDRIKALRKAKKMTQTKLVAAVKKRGGDLSQSQLSAIEAGEVDRPGALIEIAEEFAVFPNWLLTGEGIKDRTHRLADWKGPDPVEEELGIVPRARAAPPLPASALTGEATIPQAPTQLVRADVPVWSSAEVDQDGAMVLVNNPINWIRSDRMQGVKDPFAFQMFGSSMSPAVDHSDLLVINPSLLPIDGKDHVFLQTKVDGTILALVRRLVESTGKAWKVRQFNPKKDFDLPKSKWSKAFVISEKRIV